MRLGRDPIDPARLMGQQPVELALPPVEVAPERAGALADRPKEQGLSH
jgi:hypothetical protein